MVRPFNLTTPIQVGFGIKDSRSFETACSIAQGGIIGSAFIEAIAAEGELQYKIKQFIHRINKKHGYDYSIKTNN